MAEVRIGTFNLGNLALPDAAMAGHDRWSTAEAAWRQDWIARQIVAMDADVIAFQEVIDLPALEQAMALADRIGAAHAPPGRDWRPYGTGAILHAPNAHDGRPGRRKPGLAVVSRLPVTGQTVVQDIRPPLELPLLDDTAAGTYRLARLSRPVQRVDLTLGRRGVTLFNLHLRSRLPGFRRAQGATHAPGEDLLALDPALRADGAFAATTRRAAEAMAARRMILQALAEDRAVIALGDFNDGPDAPSTRIIAGEPPVEDFTRWSRAGATGPDDTYTAAESATIRAAMAAVALTPAGALAQSASGGDFTALYGGAGLCLDHILLSRHFAGAAAHVRVLNDHLTLPPDPARHEGLIPDHGQVVVHIEAEALT